eukprot:gene527-2458_t
MAPDGTARFVLALNHLAAPYYQAEIQGASGLAPCHPYDEQCLHYDLLHTKYNGSWAAATTDFVAKSRELYFNSAGYEFVPSPGIDWSYLPDLFVTNASHIFANHVDPDPSFPDVFDPAFNATTDARVKAWVAQDRHSSSRRILSQTRGGLPDARTVYHLPSSVQTWAEVLQWPFTGLDPRAPGVEADDTLFLGVVADKYFGVASAAVRRHDPAGLVFGQRFLSNDVPAPVMAAAGRHFDVISVQPAPFSFCNESDARASAETLGRISQLSGGRPVFVADQATHWDETPDRKLPVDSALACVPDQATAGELYRVYLELLTSMPQVVGYSRCQYIDRVVMYAGQTSETHLKQGILDFDGTFHSVFAQAVARANHDLVHQKLR